MPNPEEVLSKEELSSEQNIVTNEQISNIVDNTYLQTQDSSFDSSFTQSTGFIQPGSQTTSKNTTGPEKEFGAEVSIDTQIPQEVPVDIGNEPVTTDNKEKDFNSMLKSFSMQSRGKIREVRDREAYVPPSLKEKIKSEKARRRDRRSRRRQY